MGKYKPGDKFVIEIANEYHHTAGSGAFVGSDSLYRIRGFNALMFDDYGLDKLEKYVGPPKEVKDAVQERIAELTAKIMSLEAERDNLCDYRNEIEDRPMPF